MFFLKMSQLELDDLIYSYRSPDEFISTGGFQGYISGKKEFMEMGANASEESPGREGFFSHQHFIHRFMLMYNSSLAIWETGVGKSCGAGGATEAFRSSYLSKAIKSFIEDYVHPRLSTIRRVYIIVSGKTIGNEFKKQLYCKCSQEATYERNEKVMRARATTARSRALSNILNKYYTVETYGAFTKRVRERGMSDQEIIDTFSDCMFVVDEAQNLVYDPRETTHEIINGQAVKKRTPYTGTHSYMKGSSKDIIKDQFGNQILGAVNEKGDILKTPQKRAIYDAMDRIFTLAKRSKKMLLSATPMTASSSQFPVLMNLIQEPNKKLPLDWDYSTITAEQLRPYIEGKISYVRAFESRARPVYKGETVPLRLEVGGRIYQSSTVIYKDRMAEPMTGQNLTKAGGFLGQRAAYDAISASLTEAQRSFHNVKRQGSNFIFPDGSTGSAGFNKYVDRIGPYRFAPNPELKRWISRPNALRYLSTKFASIIELVKKAPGKVFIYCNFKMGSGSILLALCLIAQPEFMEYIVPKASETMRPLCGRSDENVSYGNFRNSVAILTPELQDAKISSTLDYFNHKDNMDGKYIKVLITSPVGGEGINVNNVTQIHVVDPDWTETKIYQAISRGIRATSHDYLIEKQEKIMIKQLQQIMTNARSAIMEAGKTVNLNPNDIRDLSAIIREVMPLYGEFLAVEDLDRKALFSLYSEGIGIAVRILQNAMPKLDKSSPAYITIARHMESFTNIPNPRNIDIPIEIYQHAATGSIEATDVPMYIASEKKDIDIKRMIRILKVLAVDCHAHRARNVRPTDVNMSKACEYMECDYKCIDPMPAEVDYSSYDVLYSSKEMSDIIKSIRDYFSSNFAVTSKDLKEMLPGHRAQVVELAISKMVDEKMPVYDRYGYPSYVAEEKGSLFIQRDYPVGTAPNYTKSYYSSSMTAMLFDNMDQYNVDTARPEQERLIGSLAAAFQGNKVNNGMLNSILSQMNVETKSELFEGVIIKKFIEKKSDLLVETIYDKYKDFHFTVREPVLQIREVANILRSSGTSKGRTPTDESLSQNITDKLSRSYISGKGKIMHVNTLLTVKNLGSYEISTKFFKADGAIRILAVDKPEWKTAAVYERPVYSAMARIKLANDIRAIENKAAQLMFMRTGARGSKVVYGSLLPDNKFRIIDKVIGEVLDARTGGRGRECKTRTLVDILLSIYQLRIPYTGFSIDTSRLSTSAMLSTIRDQRIELPSTTDRSVVEYIYKWAQYSTTSNRETICRMVRAFMEKHGIIFKRVI